MAKSKPLTVTQKYELAMEYIAWEEKDDWDAFVAEDFREWLKKHKHLTDDQIKQFERLPF